ncbi:hypothetical protein CPC08DRAFT_394782 [Agrocybe pediades]|nr:hypothetical protein CPC08DRAFT_394782 [Agrocybe pediades]
MFFFFFFSVERKAFQLCWDFFPFSPSLCFLWRRLSIIKHNRQCKTASCLIKHRTEASPQFNRTLPSPITCAPHHLCPLFLYVFFCILLALA